MHDLQAHDMETIVIDVDDWHAPKVVEEVVMHAHIEGVWHRLTPNHQAAACGALFHAAFTPLRRQELTGPLCATCFTAFEQGQASDVENAEALALAAHEPLNVKEWLTDLPRSNNSPPRKKR